MVVVVPGHGWMVLEPLITKWMAGQQMECGRVPKVLGDVVNGDGPRGGGPAFCQVPTCKLQAVPAHAVGGFLGEEHL